MKLLLLAQKLRGATLRRHPHVAFSQGLDLIVQLQPDKGVDINALRLIEFWPGVTSQGLEQIVKLLLLLFGWTDGQKEMLCRLGAPRFKTSPITYARLMDARL